MFILFRLLGCPRASVSQTAKELDSKSSSSFIMRRTAKVKNGRSLTSSSSEDPSSDLVEATKSVKRITRHNGGGGVEEGKLPEKVSVGKKGTAAALMGGKRASTTSPNETRLEMSKIITQSTRRATLEKPIGSSNSVQRKIPNAKRTLEETITHSKTEGGSLKRRRVEDGVEGAQGNVENVTTVQTVVRHSIVEEEEIVESSMVDIYDNEPVPLVDEKKKHVQETQQLLPHVSLKSTVDPQSGQSPSSQKVLSQQDDEHLDAENRETVIQIQEETTAQVDDLDVAVFENRGTTKEVSEEDKNTEVEYHGNLEKDLDCAATLSDKSEECFPSVDAGSEVFCNGDDIENLLRIEQRCASVQSWVARHSREVTVLEPNVEQMEVEEEVTVEGGGVLLEEACAVPNSEEIREKIYDEYKKTAQTDEITVGESTSAAVAETGGSDVDEERTASCKRINEGARMQTAVESLTADDENLTMSQSSNINNDEAYCRHISEDVGLIEHGSTNNLSVDSDSTAERPTSKDLNGTENHGPSVENTSEGNDPCAAESTASAIEMCDEVSDRKSTNGRLTDENVYHMADNNTKAVVGTVSPTVTETSDTKTKSCSMPEVMQLDEQCSRAVKATVTDSQMPGQCDSASTTVPQRGSSPAASAAREEGSSFQVTGETSHTSSENLPGMSQLADKELDRSRENTDAADKLSSYEVHSNAIGPEDELRPSKTRPESTDEFADAEASYEECDEKVVRSSAVSVQSGPAPVLSASTTSGVPAVGVVVTRTFTSTVAGSGGPAATSVVTAGAVPGFVGMPPVAIRAAVPGSAVGSVFVHVADPRQFAMHLQQQQQQGQVQGQAQTPVFHIPTLSPQQGGGPPQLVMSPLSPQQVALLSSSMPATTQPPHQLMGAVPPRHVTLVTSGPRPQLLQQCLLTSAGPQPLTLLSAPQSASTSNSTSGVSSTAAQPSVPVQHLAILSHALQGAGGTAASTTVPTSGHQQPVALIAAAAGPNQTPVMRMSPAVIPRHPMSASSAMQHLTSAVQQTISLQQLQLSFAAAAAAAQQQQQLASSAVRSPIPIHRLPVLCTAQPSATSSTTPPSTTTSLAVVSMATAPVVSMPVSSMVSVAASALTAFLKKENVAPQLLPPPATTIAKLSPHDVALKGAHCCVFLLKSSAVRTQ